MHQEDPSPSEQAKTGRRSLIPPTLNDVAQHMSQGLAILDGEGRVLYLNPALRSMLLLADDVPALPCALSSEACPPDLCLALNPSYAEVIGPYSVTISPPSGPEKVLEVWPSKTPQGEVRFLLDVTHQRRAARQRAELFSLIAHEFRAPLQHIMGFTGILASFNDLSEDSRSGYVQQIDEESQYMARLLEDLVALARIEDGHFSVNMAAVQVDVLLERVMSHMRPIASARGLTIRLVREDSPVWLLTDGRRLEQVVTNLVDNAFKFVQPGGTITICLHADEDNVTLQVQDSGPGIPPDALGHLFEPYYRVLSTDTEAIPGTGLGLYISREIIERLGGQIWAESEPGRGSAFFIRLPAS